MPSVTPASNLKPAPWWRLSEFLVSFREPWDPVSKGAVGTWIGAYVLFLIYAIRHNETSLFIDLVFIPIHEGGHLLFGWFGQTLGVAGGTILQLGVPLAVGVAFAYRRLILGASFGLFCFFENWLNVGTYMADARAQALPLLTVGDADYVIHDWAYMFAKLGLIQFDTAIGHLVRVTGWLGMFGVVGWLAYRAKLLGRNA